MNDEKSGVPTAEQFWMVWCEGNRAPTYKHPSGKLAGEEAQRLARMNPGQRFFVVKATGGYVVQETPVSVIRLTEPVPF